MNTAKSLFCCLLPALLIASIYTSPVVAQSLEGELAAISIRELASQAKAQGDPQRGAVVFFQHHLACSKCHAVGKTGDTGLGPNLATLGGMVSDEYLIEAVLTPSKTIRKGFESVTVALTDGTTLAALQVERTADKLVVRDVARGGAVRTLTNTEIEAIKQSETSIMPAGQVNQLNSRQQFLDLIRYLMEIRDGGEKRAAELQPSPSLLTFTVPEYESHLDHAALIADWNDAALKRGAATYQRVCANCHGTVDKPGSLPTSLRFAEGKFKNGGDPLSMYRTLTHGFGLMAPQTWMVPSQKYDVIHYIRETYLKPHNPSQLVAVDRAYLSRLPKGDTRGPEPSKIVAWSAMDYGPSLAHTYEIPGLAHNFAYKGVAVRLDPGAGGVSRGRHWLIFDTDTLRVAGAWNAASNGKQGNADDNFIDWRGIQFNGEHGIHPRTVGQTILANGTGPGWANPTTNQFRDDQRIQGRDGKRYGPLPRTWGNYRGQYHHGQQVVFSYTIGTTEILESPSLLMRDGKESPLVLRTFNIGPRERDLLLQVAEHSSDEARLTLVPKSEKSTALLTVPQQAAAKSEPAFAFDGNTYVEIPNAESFDLVEKDFSIVARVKTKQDGTIWSITQPGPKWIPDGQSLFIRGGRLTFDIGWVGAVTGKTKIADGNWHQVALTWQKPDARVRLYVDGKLDGEGKLAAKASLPKRVARIGYTAPNFPQPATFFTGEIAEARFYQQRLTDGLADFAPQKPSDSLVARWLPVSNSDTAGNDTSGNKNNGEVRRGFQSPTASAGPIVAGFSPQNIPTEWLADGGKLRLRIPAGKEPLRFTVWTPTDGATIESKSAATYAAQFADVAIAEPARDLTLLTQGGPARWPQKLTTQAIVGSSTGPFATDILTAPETNPWLAQMRFTGLDFFPDGRSAICTWDGDVWIVADDNGQLSWQRIATGLFQPLGLKIQNGKIHLTCRDQLVVLHDLNGDLETDFYECLNNDHQVTEHFHEFAMGLQTDAAGNFYYAKSGCHGKAAVVPHHGTLLRVSADGSKTEILATGFRAANGVCLNPDGSFVVTDQEGFWNPKNRINWVEVASSGKPNFYGNMLGYHDVTDSSDSAMIPPLCWITNAFDRSPAELLWVNSERWGPLNGSLLNLSYGYGKVFLVPHERVNGQMQGGLIELPISAFPTGVMRGRFHPRDGELYLCGMFAWAGSATAPGGFYRLRATGQPMHLPVGLSAKSDGLELKFTEPLAASSVDTKNVRIKTWSLKRTADYGSKHYNERQLTIERTALSADGKTLHLVVKDIEPTWCMEIDYTLTTADGKPIHGIIHNTIHSLK